MRRMRAIEEGAAENFVDDFGVGLGIATGDGFERRAVEAEVLGRNFVGANRAAADFGDVGFRTEGNFVEAVGAVNNEGASDAEFGESAGQKFGEMRSGNSDDLRGGSGGIGERAEKIENGANAEGAAGGHSVLHGGVNGGREEKSDADFFDGLADARGRLFDDDAELFEDVGCAGARTCGAIAVLGDAHACSGDDEGRGSGNVESIAAVAAGTAGIHEHFVGARMAGGENRRGVAAHGGGEADEFVDGFALHAESDEEGGDERVVGVAREDLLHDRVGFGAGEVFAREEFFEGGGNHELAARRRTSRFLRLS